MFKWLFAAAVAACLAGPVAGAPSATPKIVVQAADPGGVEIAAWFPGDRLLLTANGASRTLMVWDVTTGLVVDRERIAVSPSQLVALGEAQVFEQREGPDPEISPPQVWVRMSGEIMSVQGLDFVQFLGPLGTMRPMLIGGLAKAGSGMAAREVRRLERFAQNPEAKASLEAFRKRQLALAVIYEGAHDLTPEAAVAALPELPKSNDGRFMLKRSAEGLIVCDAKGAPLRTLSRSAPMAYAAAALSPDGERMALVDDLKRPGASGRETPVHGFDIRRSSPAPDILLPGEYGAVAWIDAQRYLVTPAWSPDDRELGAHVGDPAPAVIVDAVRGQSAASFPSLCYMAPLPGGGFVGAGLPSCRRGAQGPPGLFRRDAEGDWKAFAPAATGDRLLDGLAVSPDGRRLAVVTADLKSSWSHSPYADTEYIRRHVAVLDLATGQVLRSIDLGANMEPNLIAFSADGETVIYGNPSYGAALPLNGPPKSLAGFNGAWSANDGKSLLYGSVLEGSVRRVDLRTGAYGETLAIPEAIAGGFVLGRDLFWAASVVDGVSLYDTHDWRLIFTTYQFEGGGFLTTTPSGRYDTNLGADSDRFRWVFDDAPTDALAPQTFMRDYYEPRLAQRLLACVQGEDCETAFPPVRPLGSLNRVLPAATIVGIAAGPKPNTAVVEVKVEDVQGPRRFLHPVRRSGTYDLRLYRDGKLVGEAPIPTEDLAGRKDIDSWRGATRLEAGIHRFNVALPSGAAGDTTFSAYLFNEDRVKGDTTRQVYARAASPARQPRAYVLAIGENAYDHSDWNLHFAAADARLTGERLARIPGREAHVLTLVSDEKAKLGTKALIRDAIALLAPGAGASSARARLAAAGLSQAELAGFQAATPDDVVILAYSGHGMAVPHGAFYLLPSDFKLDAADKKPLPESLISSAELTAWLRTVDAGEMAFIIDACNSAASVEGDGFKPGPFGDAGLGQLAFDKGFRIIAASQAQESALEDERLGHGLLTAALSEEGLDDQGFGKADLNGDGRITLDEWLRYAVQRLPALSAEVGQARGARGVTLINQRKAAPRQVQEPSLFDFTGRPSPVVLRAARAGPARAGS